MFEVLIGWLHSYCTHCVPVLSQFPYEPRRASPDARGSSTAVQRRHPSLCRSKHRKPTPSPPPPGSPRRTAAPGCVPPGSRLRMLPIIRDKRSIRLSSRKSIFISMRKPIREPFRCVSPPFASLKNLRGGRFLRDSKKPHSALQMHGELRLKRPHEFAYHRGADLLHSTSIFC